jgi:lycopene cyclase domain-containing protein
MIPTYTILSVFALLGVFLLDRKLGTRVYLKNGFHDALAAAIVFQLVFDNWAASLGFWEFNPSVGIGMYAPFIPMENLMFGAAMFWLVSAVFTYLNDGKSSSRERV